MTSSQVTSHVRFVGSNLITQISYFQNFFSCLHFNLCDIVCLHYLIQLQVTNDSHDNLL